MKALTFVICTCAMTAMANPAPDSENIFVTGLGSQTTVPDLANICLKIEKLDQDLQKAKMDVDARTEAVVQAATQHGIADKDITAARLDIEVEHHWENGKSIYDGNLVRREVYLTLRDIDKYNALLTALIDAKITSISFLEFTSTQREALELQARSAALADARTKAESMAKALGAKLGTVFSISEELPRDYQCEDWGATIGGVSEKVDKKEVFKPGTITFAKRVYVVFRLLVK